MNRVGNIINRNNNNNNYIVNKLDSYLRLMFLIGTITTVTNLKDH